MGSAARWRSLQRSAYRRSSRHGSHKLRRVLKTRRILRQQAEQLPRDHRPERSQTRSRRAAVNFWLRPGQFTTMRGRGRGLEYAGQEPIARYGAAQGDGHGVHARSSQARVRSADRLYNFVQRIPGNAGSNDFEWATRKSADLDFPRNFGIGRHPPRSRWPHDLRVVGSIPTRLTTSCAARGRCLA